MIHIDLGVGLCRGRQAVRAGAEIHPRRLHPDRPLGRGPDASSSSTTSSRIKRCKEFTDAAKAKPERLIFYVVGPLRRSAHSDGAVPQGGGHQVAASADERWRPGAHRAARQQRAGAGFVGVGLPSRRSRPARCGRWRCSAPSASKSLPDVPTMKELGYNIEYYLWVGMFAPKGTPTPIVDKLRDARSGTRRMAMRSRARSPISARTSPISIRPDFAKFWDEDAARVEDAVRTIGKVGTAKQRGCRECIILRTDHISGAAFVIFGAAISR